jgi:hypothetical protein
MVQRIQSVYLFLAAVIYFFMLGRPIAELQIDDTLFLQFYHLKIIPASDTAFQAISTWPVSVLIFTIMGISFINIFLYRKRILQIRLCVFNIILMFGLVGLIYFFTKYTLNDLNGITSVFLWPIVVPFISIVLTYMALKGIQKDEALIRSYNRIR